MTEFVITCQGGTRITINSRTGLVLAMLADVVEWNDLAWNLISSGGKSLEQVKAFFDATGTEYAEVPSVYPKKCTMCGYDIDSANDLDFHGLGNCVEICKSCGGAGCPQCNDSGHQGVRRVPL